MPSTSSDSIYSHSLTIDQLKEVHIQKPAVDCEVIHIDMTAAVSESFHSILLVDRQIYKDVDASPESFEFIHKIRYGNVFFVYFAGTRNHGRTTDVICKFKTLSNEIRWFPLRIVESDVYSIVKLFESLIETRHQDFIKNCTFRPSLRNRRAVQP